MNECSFCNLLESKNNPFLAGKDWYICSNCMLSGYKNLFGDMKPSEVEITEDKDEYFIEARDIIESMYEELKQVNVLNNSKQAKVNTSFHALNEKLNGFTKGELILLSSRPGMGKTSLAINMALNAMEKGEGVAYFSLEMSSESLMKRMLSAKTSISLKNLRFGELKESEWSYLFDATGRMSKEKFFVDDMSFTSIRSITNELQDLKKQHTEITLAFIDYLQLADYTITANSMLKKLKELAENLGIAIIVLHQLNRSLEYRDDKRPVLDDIEESFQERVDTILFIYREEVHNQIMKEKKQTRVERESEEEAEIIIGKSYSGEIGVVKHIFQNDFLRFVDIEHKFEQQ